MLKGLIYNYFHKKCRYPVKLKLMLIQELFFKARIIIKKSQGLVVQN